MIEVLNIIGTKKIDNKRWNHGHSQGGWARVIVSSPLENQTKSFCMCGAFCFPMRSLFIPVGGLFSYVFISP